MPNEGGTVTGRGAQRREQGEITVANGEKGTKSDAIW